MSSGDVELSEAQIMREAEALSQRVLHTSAEEALRRVRSGALEGTLFAAKIVRLFALLGKAGPHSDAPNTPQAAAE